MGVGPGAVIEVLRASRRPSGPPQHEGVSGCNPPTFITPEEPPKAASRRTHSASAVVPIAFQTSLSAGDGAGRADGAARPDHGRELLAALDLAAQLVDLEL